MGILDLFGNSVANIIQVYGGSVINSGTLDFPKVMAAAPGKPTETLTLIALRIEHTHLRVALLPAVTPGRHFDDDEFGRIALELGAEFGRCITRQLRLEPCRARREREALLATRLIIAISLHGAERHDRRALTHLLPLANVNRLHHAPFEALDHLQAP